MSDAAPGGKRHKYTAVGQQATALERLMQNPDKPVKLPEPPKEKTVRPPPDMVKNVSGSTSGAGSGEFHVYTQARQREYERLTIMAEKAEKVACTKLTQERAHAAFVEKQERHAAEDARKTSKNRARRDKKKAAVQRAKEGGLPPQKRRLLAPDTEGAPDVRAAGTPPVPEDQQASAADAHDTR